MACFEQRGSRGRSGDRGYLGTVLRLALRASTIVEAALEGWQLPDLGLLKLLEPLSVIWTK